MRLLESAPQRYDFGIRLLSLGHIDRVYVRVAQLDETGKAHTAAISRRSESRK